MADRGQITGGILDEPLAFDNSVSLVAAKTKGIRSAIAGRAESRAACCAIALLMVKAKRKQPV